MGGVRGRVALGAAGRVWASSCVCVFVCVSPFCFVVVVFLCFDRLNLLCQILVTLPQVQAQVLVTMLRVTAPIPVTMLQVQALLLVTMPRVHYQVLVMMPRVIALSDSGHYASNAGSGPGDVASSTSSGFWRRCFVSKF